MFVSEFDGPAKCDTGRLIEPDVAIGPAERERDGSVADRLRSGVDQFQKRRRHARQREQIPPVVLEHVREQCGVTRAHEIEVSRSRAARN